MKKIRWGLVSTANINQQLMPAIRASRRGELAAVASRSQEKAEAYAQEWKIPQAFGGYQEMFTSGAVDAVYVSLPNHLHAEWSIRAMRAGIHVLCEKPFAITLPEVDAMTAASRETGTILAEAFMYRHHPQTKAAGDFVQSGELGDLSLVRGAFDFFMSEKERQPGQLNVRLVPKYGGGCLWDVGVYPLSFTQFIMDGPPQEVVGNQWVGDSGVDETFAGQMLYLGEVEDMHAAILDGKPNLVTLEETRNHVRTVLALYESAQADKPMRL
ncbi:MAG: 1,5-anhydro-D-fructose reductase [Chloroflexi bacterium]|nr:1,5-anhydro-D-fructose reductase [Chloroflexota bacterium]